MNLEDATTDICHNHDLVETDVRRALILTREHLRSSVMSMFKDKDWTESWEDEHRLLNEWLTLGTEWPAPDWSDTRDAASWLLHRNVACTWAVLIAHNRSKA